MVRSQKSASDNKIRLACEVCQTGNYSTTKSAAITASRLVRKKYCPHCNQHTLHRQTL
ncbi:MAG: 50S ribosomal protein L33 [Cyanobacteria bacterium HKST-UBA06]|nr:50S ribosomal protein L33 [Cyanobacteria bacterium HKST-UBA05]MCA9798233.1 50S ribosomal protein L33 [Cyanobacteria bacterium HKST-UBA04]MCA9806737.1 50S ribosomal protein L33 [Cyanobacteria bacterium HKST-UBA06]MCA9841204.1 50S ribosomal protein L33 [Cyanobacteria bacterium HKST-UBA03]